MYRDNREVLALAPFFAGPIGISTLYFESASVFVLVPRLTNLRGATPGPSPVRTDRVRGNNQRKEIRSEIAQARRSAVTPGTRLVGYTLGRGEKSWRITRCDDQDASGCMGGWGVHMSKKMTSEMPAFRRPLVVHWSCPKPNTPCCSVHHACILDPHADASVPR